MVVMMMMMMGLFYNDGTPQLGQMHHNCLGDCIV